MTAPQDLTIDTSPKSATIGEIAKAIADAVVMDPHAMAAIKEWQQSRSEAMMHGASTKEGDRFKAACEALAAVVCK